MERSELIAVMAATIYAAKPFSRKPRAAILAKMEAMVESAQEAEELFQIVHRNQHAIGDGG